MAGWGALSDAVLSSDIAEAQRARALGQESQPSVRRGRGRPPGTGGDRETRRLLRETEEAMAAEQQAEQQQLQASWVGRGSSIWHARKFRGVEQTPAASELGSSVGRPAVLCAWDYEHDYPGYSCYGRFMTN